MAQQLRKFLMISCSIVVLAWCGTAQVNRTPSYQIQVRVAYDNERPAGAQIRLDLTNETGTTITQGFTDSSGTVFFHVAGSGVYRVRASGLEIEDGVSEAIQVDQYRNSQIIFMHVKLKPSASGSSSTQSVSKQGTAPVTSAAQLAVPNDARKAFDKGLADWQKKDFEKAAAQFEKAVALYPTYDTAYNNLGVMYAHLQQPEKAMAAFEKSVQLNDKNADADRNLARMCIRQKNYVRAEDLLHKSLVVDPLDPGSLTMLSLAEFENGKMDEALSDARKVHGVPHDRYALSHFIAGQALEQKHQYQDASAEYMVYLRESPNGPEVTMVKDALDRLNASGASAQSKQQ